MLHIVECSARKRCMKNVLWSTLVLLCAAVLLWWQLQPGGPVARRERPPVPVSLVAAQTGDFQDQASAVGTLLAWESVDISASVSQIVTSIAFEDGQQVRKGDVLALLKQDAEQATLSELQATLLDAEREVRRLENLARKNQVAQTELDKARTREDITRHQIEGVQARIADRTIVAPFDGVLGLRQVSEGALITPGQKFTTLDDISRMRLEFTLPARLLSFLSTGQEVRVRTPAIQREFSGVISAVGSRIDPVARSISARAEIDNSEQLLRPGMLMEVVVRGPMRRTLLVPEESLQSRSVEHYVWRFEDGQAVRTVVEIGSRIPGWVEIVSGIPEGALIVRDGVGRLSGDSVPVLRVDS